MSASHTCPPRSAAPTPALARLSGRLLVALLAVAALAACGGSDEASTEPTLCGTVAPETTSTAAVAAIGGGAAATRPLPSWYDDAKLGIMIHWGVWSVPAWAETTLDPENVADPDHPDYLLAPGGIEKFVGHNPYSEWYENSLAIDGTATQAFHRETYGADFPYTGFQPLFEEESQAWQPEEWARLFAQARARYVVLVTKHHDGYTLWPSAVENAGRPSWNSPRDVVGELATSVRDRCLRIGVYYSGGIDWSFQAPPLATALDFLQSVPPAPEYARYVDDHWRELIARYRPSILWNDITSPEATDEQALFTDYYAAIPDGVVNDRWSLDPTAIPHDFRTVEYDVRDEISPDKWETVRGIGKTFGFNRNEPAEDYGTPEKYLHLLIDVVSKNGNLLLNVGPTADGTIPEPQVVVLRALGAWLDRNGEAIFGTRPWLRFGGTTAEGDPVRFTQKGDGRTVYAMVLGTPASRTITLGEFAATPARIRLVGSGESLAWERFGGEVRIQLGALPDEAAHAIAIELDPS
jgi:alpha-L-fucosidase